MIFGSVCSGIEAASVAWSPLGWRPAFFSEIDKFPSEVLAHHYGSNMPGEPLSGNGVPNYGDMTQFREWPDHGPTGNTPIDLLVGGTPCQSFSIAGLRQGMDDPRGNLALVYCGILDRYRPRWFAWENVPGVLSSRSGGTGDAGANEPDGLAGDDEDGQGEAKDFACLLNAFQQLGYGFAYRVLDAQFIRTYGFERAVPQRRRRVVVVGYLGDWRPAAAVLFEPESVSGNPPPRRKTPEGPSGTITARPSGGGGLGTDLEIDGGLVAGTLDAGMGRRRGSGANPNAFVPVAARLVSFGEYALDGTASPVLQRDYKYASDLVAHTLRADGFDASEDGSGRGTPLVPVGFDSKASVPVSEAGISPTLRSMTHSGSHANAGGQVAVAIQERAGAENPSSGPDGVGVNADGAAYTLEARTRAQAVAYGDDPEAWAVRRLIPLECERLQCFPDNFTAIPRANGKPAADGPRYRALGNSMAVNVMRWLGHRIQLVDDMITKGELE